MYANCSQSIPEIASETSRAPSGQSARNPADDGGRRGGQGAAAATVAAAPRSRPVLATVGRGASNTLSRSASASRPTRASGAASAASGIAARGAPEATPDAQAVIARLEEAGRALLCLPNTGYTTRMRLNAIEFVRSALTGEGWEHAGGEAPARVRPSLPDPQRITRMDEALAWIGLIPQDRYVLRRIVGCRALVSPTTERHLFPWRRIGTLIGADHKAVQRWHAQGIDTIVAALAARR